MSRKSNSRNTQQRRGVLMLIVLIILTLFVLLVLTYLLSSGQAQRLANASSSSSSSGGAGGGQAQADLSRIAHEVVAGSTTPRSAFHLSGLLEDMWGEGDTRPYSGTGIDATSDGSSVPYALQWNPRGWLGGANFDTLDAGFAATLAGGLDEDYDAADYRNPALAMMDENGNVTRPSFHDPWLIRYMQANHGMGSNDALKRRVLFRPIIEDHTAFDGSNPGFDPYTNYSGPWDVDNDGDGRRDSVWIYSGDPIQPGAGGISIVPLYAIMLIDLDSRLNVNLHSNTGISAATGFGFGPAEVSLSGVTADQDALVLGRYGADGVPSEAGNPVASIHQWTFPAAAWTAADVNGWGSPHDLFGSGSVALAGVGTPSYSGQSATANNPYRLNIVSGVGDEFYTFAELERVLRAGDVDAGTLPARLAGLVDTSARYRITSYSADSTAPGGPFDATGYDDRLAKSERIDLNMLFGDGIDNNGNGIVDEPAEAASEIVWWTTGNAPAGVPAAYENVALDTVTYNRGTLIQSLYDVAMNVTPTTSDLWADAATKQKIMAQWAVNVIDFRDRDSIMTPFLYDGTNTVWGCESPQLVISETTCWHDRCTQDASVAGLTTDATPDPNFDQVRRPRGPLFVELKKRESAGESVPAEFHAVGGADDGKLMLNKLTPAGSFPIWRLAITRTTATNTTASPTLPAADVERAVYFAASGSLTMPNADIEYWAGAGDIAIGDGEYCTIGPPNKTYFGTRTNQASATGYDAGNEIDMAALSGVTVPMPDVVTGGNTTRFSATEPTAGYVNTAEDAAGLYAAAVDLPFDDGDPDLLRYGTIDNYKVLHLQRLANPLVAWDATTNPYITVDSMPLTMTVYTGEEPTPGVEASTGSTLVVTSTMKFDSRSRDGNGNTNIWIASYPVPSGGTVVAPLPTDTLGGHNAGLDPTSGTLYPWLTWHDRPYANQLELLLVPRSAPQTLLADHTIGNTGSPYTTPDAPFGHLPSPFLAPATVAERPQLHRILEYVDVPSPFAGTRVYEQPSGAIHPSYFGTSSRTNPGRVNINTLTSPVWDGVLNGMPGPTFAELAASRQGYAAADIANYPTAFARPFRSFAGNAAIPDGVSVPSLTGGGELNDVEVDFTLLRPNAAGTAPLLAPSNRDPYFQYQSLAKLSSVLTNRSNVYALWITVGFFEAESVTPSAAFPEGIRIGKEAGSNTGNIVRNRAFFIIDRSRSDYTTGAFTRGDQSQMDQVLILSRPIE